MGRGFRRWGSRLPQGQVRHIAKPASALLGWRRELAEGAGAVHCCPRNPHTFMSKRILPSCAEERRPPPWSPIRMTFLKPLVIDCSVRRSRIAPNSSAVMPIVPGRSGFALLGVKGSTGRKRAFPSFTAIACTVAWAIMLWPPLAFPWTALLDAAGIDKCRGSAGRQRLLHFHPGHLLELNRLRSLGAGGGRQG